MNTITKKLLYLSLAVFIFGTGYKLGQFRESIAITKPHNITTSNDISKNKAQNIDFNLFWEVWSKLDTNFVDHNKLDPKKMYYGAIKGMVASLGDPYTFFLTPEENKLTKDDLGGRFEGIGAQLGLKDSSIVVIAPLKSSPAEKAGVKGGDTIMKVDGKSTLNWSLLEAVSKIRGKKGTKVSLALSRRGKEINVNITRDEIKVKSVELTFEKDIAILKLSQFGDDTNTEWDKATRIISEKYNNKSVSGMVLDMRDNPGGYLESSVYITSEFVGSGKTIVKQEYIDRTSKDYTVDHTGKLLDIPLVVLINKGSASAAEIVAGSLRDHKRAKLVGEKSFGKGSIQDALDISEGAGLHVTIAKWILPKGDWIHEKGVMPEIVVENKIDNSNTLTRENDLQLDKAIELLVK